MSFREKCVVSFNSVVHTVKLHPASNSEMGIWELHCSACRKAKKKVLFQNFSSVVLIMTYVLLGNGKIIWNEKYSQTTDKKFGSGEKAAAFAGQISHTAHYQWGGGHCSYVSLVHVLALTPAPAFKSGSKSHICGAYNFVARKTFIAKGLESHRGNYIGIPFET